MNKTAWITIIVLVVLVAGGLIWWYSSMATSSTVAPAYQEPTSTDSYSTSSMPLDTNMSSTATSTSVATSSKPSTSASAAVTISNYAFAPATLTVHKGTTVTWTNQDNVAHTVTGNNGGPSSGDIAQGGTYSYTFDTVGTFAYHCAIHPSMKATVKVIN